VVQVGLQLWGKTVWPASIWWRLVAPVHSCNGHGQLGGDKVSAMGSIRLSAVLKSTGQMWVYPAYVLTLVQMLRVRWMYLLAGRYCSRRVHVAAAGSWQAPQRRALMCAICLYSHCGPWLVW
jgi:hypothetical protein